MNFWERFKRSELLHSLYMDHEDMITLAFVSGVGCILRMEGFILNQTFVSINKKNSK